MTVILLRHGRSTSNTAHTLAGRSEGVDLDALGQEQAQAVVHRIGDLPVKAIVRSPLLTEYLPGTPDRLIELGAFLSLPSCGTPSR